jgi:hypothetical protein
MAFKFRVRSRFAIKLPRRFGVGVELCAVRLGVWQYEEEE